MQQSQISIAINTETLQKLIQSGVICISDLTCLDKSSKQALQRCFLKSLLSPMKN